MRTPATARDALLRFDPADPKAALLLRAWLAGEAPAGVMPREAFRLAPRSPLASPLSLARLPRVERAFAGLA